MKTLMIAFTVLFVAAFAHAKNGKTAVVGDASDGLERELRLVETFVTIPQGRIVLGTAENLEEYDVSSFEMQTTEVTQQQWIEAADSYEKQFPKSSMVRTPTRVNEQSCLGEIKLDRVGFQRAIERARRRSQPGLERPIDPDEYEFDYLNGLYQAALKRMRKAGRELLLPDDYVEPLDYSYCPRYPVSGIKAEDVSKYILLLNTRGDGFYYRRPSRPEWIYAARGQTPLEPRADDLKSQAWISLNSGPLPGPELDACESKGFNGMFCRRTQPVGLKKRNAFGLFDMLGNVAELTDVDSSGTGTFAGCSIHDLFCSFSTAFTDLHGGPNGASETTGVRIVRVPAHLKDVAVAKKLRDFLAYDSHYTSQEKQNEKGFKSPEFKRVKPGTFIMGMSKNEYHPHLAHEVTISKTFEIGAKEISQMQWVAIMGKNPSYFKRRHHCPNDYVEIQSEDETTETMCPELPVEQVTAAQVGTFLGRLNKTMNPGLNCGNQNTPDGIRKARSTKGCLRLPSEAEWEWAAQSSGIGGEWRYENSTQPHPVGTSEQNAIGLYDLMGNVAEWTSDWGYTFFGDSKIDPVGLDVTHYGGRVFKGCQWSMPTTECNIHSRFFGKESVRFGGAYVPGFSLKQWLQIVVVQEKDWYHSVGFRLARTLLVD